MSLGDSSKTVLPSLKKFVSQDEVDAARKRRQEEWERVRKPEEPVEAPEEVHDTRSLFHKLEEQKAKKQEDFEEKFKFSNQVAKLDDDEANFLTFVSNKKEENQRKLDNEDAEFLQECRESVVNQVTPNNSLKNNDKPGRKKSDVDTSVGVKKSQTSLLAGAIKRKSVTAEHAEDDEKKRKIEPLPTQNIGPNSDTARVVGVLPGIGSYSNSDSESESTDSDEDPDLNTDMFTKPVAHVQVSSNSQTQGQCGGHG